MKKLVSLLLCAVLCLSLLSAAAVAESTPSVAIVVAGGLGDRSFYDSANEGLETLASKYGTVTKVIECKEDGSLYLTGLAEAAESCDVVFAVGWQFEQALPEAADGYPEKKFVWIDNALVEGKDNVMSVVYAQNQGSFLAGAAAAMLTTRTEIPGINENKIIGWVGGMDIPVLHDFYVGYEQGAKYIDPDIQVMQSFAGTWNDPLKGKELTLSQYALGADVVMNVASGTGNGVLEGAKEAGRFAIGVDLNQDGDQPGSVFTSMVKRVDTACYLLIESVVNGTFEGGITEYLDIEKGGVSLTDMSVVKEYLGDQFPEDILEKVAELEAKIISGEIVVDNYEGFGPAK